MAWEDYEAQERAEIIIDEIAKFRDNPLFADVVVVVGTSEFNCHRVILAAVSNFFYAAFSSKMREADERRIYLNNISSEIFSQLLDVFYLNISIVQKENLFEVWKAADFLQIPFLIRQCKVFFRNSMTESNCIRYYCEVRLLSEDERELAQDFILRKFELAAYLSEDLHMLQFDEIKSFLCSEKLEILSEDCVVEAVLKWAQPKPTRIAKETKLVCARWESVESRLPKRLCSSGNLPAESEQLNPPQEDRPSCSTSTQGQEVGDEVSSRAQYLADVLECTRYLLISRSCLVQTLACHPLVEADYRCKALVTKIFQYQAMSHLHQTWCPPAACPRWDSEITSVLVTCKTRKQGKLAIMELKVPLELKWKEISCSNLRPTESWDRKLFCYDNKLYVCSGDGYRVFYWSEGEHWNKVRVPALSHPFCIMGDALYTCDKEMCTCNSTTVQKFPISNFSTSLSWTISTPCPKQFICCSKVKNMEIRNLTSIDNTLVIFWGKEGVDSYTIEFLNISRCISLVMSEQLGSSSRLVTLRKDNEVFALQENGNLWRIQASPDYRVVNNLKLWDEEASLDGAILYGDCLLIIGHFAGQKRVAHSLDFFLPGVFKKVVKIQRCRDNQNDYADVVLTRVPCHFLPQR